MGSDVHVGKYCIMYERKIAGQRLYYFLLCAYSKI